MTPPTLSMDAVTVSQSVTSTFMEEPESVPERYKLVEAVIN